MISRSLRAHRLHRQEQFRLILAQGEKVSVGSLSFVYIPSPDGNIRLAFVVRRKCGKAVFRNRVRRILRHRFYESLDRVVMPVWGSLMYFGRESSFQSARLHEDIDQLLRSLGWA